MRDILAEFVASLILHGCTITRYPLPEITAVFRNGRLGQAFVSALLRAIKQLYHEPEFIRRTGYILRLKRVTDSSQVCIHSSGSLLKSSFRRSLFPANELRPQQP